MKKHDNTAVAPGTGNNPTTREQVLAAWLALGETLAERRTGAGLTQAELADRVYYTRATVGNLETGRQRAVRAFWKRADRALGEDGRLLAAFDDVTALANRHRAQAGSDPDRTTDHQAPADQRPL